MGTRSTFVPALSSSPTGLAFDSAGNLFVAKVGPFGAILKFAPDGTGSTFATFDPPGNDPQGLAFDSGGNLFVAVYTANTIYKFAPDGTPSTFASGRAGPFFLAIQQAPACTPDTWATKAALLQAVTGAAGAVV